MLLLLCISDHITAATSQLLCKFAGFRTYRIAYCSAVCTTWILSIRSPSPVIETALQVVAFLYIQSISCSFFVVTCLAVSLTTGCIVATVVLNNDIAFGIAQERFFYQARLGSVCRTQIAEW
ncbi:hypothetical protein D3C87_1615030 [compost metagenome]